MSAPSRPVRRADLAMDEAHAKKVLEEGYSGRLGTKGADGWPYVVPLLYVCAPGIVYFHSSSVVGRLRACLDHDPRACFLVDEPGAVYAYGRFECDSSVSYRSVMAFGTVRVMDEVTEKTSFCDALMAKYGSALPSRPKGFYTRLSDITVYAMHIHELTGKEIVLPERTAQWPHIDRTLSPLAVAPQSG